MATMPESDVKQGRLSNGDFRVNCPVFGRVLMVDIVEKHFDNVYQIMVKQNRAERTRMLRSVRSAIKEFAKSQNPTTEQSQDVCDDVAIWFCSEVIAGRYVHPWKPA